MPEKPPVSIEAVAQSIERFTSFDPNTNPLLKHPDIHEDTATHLIGKYQGRLREIVKELRGGTTDVGKVCSGISALLDALYITDGIGEHTADTLKRIVASARLSVTYESRNEDLTPAAVETSPPVAPPPQPPAAPASPSLQRETGAPGKETLERLGGRVLTELSETILELSKGKTAEEAITKVIGAVELLHSLIPEAERLPQTDLELDENNPEIIPKLNKVFNHLAKRGKHITQTEERQTLEAGSLGLLLEELKKSEPEGPVQTPITKDHPLYPQFQRTLKKLKKSPRRQELIELIISIPTVTPQTGTQLAEKLGVPAQTITSRLHGLDISPFAIERIRTSGPGRTSLTQLFYKESK